jgi:hypothetical protein
MKKMKKVKKIGEFGKQEIGCDFEVFEDIENEKIFIKEENTGQRIILKSVDVKNNTIHFVDKETIRGTDRKVEGFVIEKDIAEEIQEAFNHLSERAKKYIEENTLDDIYFEFDKKAKTIWVDMEESYAGWVLKNKMLTEEQKKRYYDFLDKYSDRLFITSEYIDEKYIDKKHNNKTLTLNQIEKELLKNKDIQEKIKKAEEKNKYEERDGKVYYDGKEIGTYTDETGFDNSFGENTEDDSDWIPGHRSYQIKKEYIEKFKKDTKHFFVDELE